MSGTRPVDRTFQFGLGPTDAPGVFARLRRTIDRLESALAECPRAVRISKPDGRWSIQEHAGHLLDLDGLFRARLDDFEAGAAVLRAADTENRRTQGAAHNEREPAELLRTFRAARSSLLDRLEHLSGPDLARTALHPRLRTPVSVVDLCYLVAEHDDHHLGTLDALAEQLLAMPLYAVDLLNWVAGALPGLLAMTDERTAVRPAPGKWSPREIVGHLIDSASNNHQRFVRATLQQDLACTGYAQDDWVAVQQYHEAPWGDLVALWAGYNRHLARVMCAIPVDIRLRVQTGQALHQLAFRSVNTGEALTLDFFMEDYVAHLQHHLRQIPELRVRDA